MKQTLLDIAELLDAFRIFPRFICYAYGFMCWHLFTWYEALKAPTSEQSAFAGAIIGLAVPLSNFYFNSGRKWTRTDQPQ